jgi:hypothetical protein
MVKNIAGFFPRQERTLIVFNFSHPGEVLRMRGDDVVG